LLKEVCPEVELSSYQVLGVNWLYLLKQMGINGILADDMGLGKTVQTVVFLALLKHLGEEGPHLVIVPASVLSNWENEFARFAPDVNVMRYHGSAAERLDLRVDYR